MILVDSSAWIEYDRGSGVPVDHALALLIAESRDQLAVSEPVLMEVLAGARSDVQATRLRRLMTSIAWTTLDPVAGFEGASRIYRHCRAAGVTPTIVVDCLIANVAMRHEAELLTADRDFEQIARVVPLRLYSV